MRMNCDKPSYEFLPYEVQVLVPDLWGKWADNWKVHSKHNTMEERDAEYEKLHETPNRRYRRAVNQYQLDAMKEAEKRRDSRIAGYAPADGREL